MPANTLKSLLVPSFFKIRNQGYKNYLIPDDYSTDILLTGT